MADFFYQCNGLVEAPALFLSGQFPTHVASSTMGRWLRAVYAMIIEAYTAMANE
jgi:hypothetical protein